MVPGGSEVKNDAFPPVTCILIRGDRYYILFLEFAKPYKKLVPFFHGDRDNYLGKKKKHKIYIKEPHDL